MADRLHIERQYSCPGITTYLISGFPPAEMDSILNTNTFEDARSRLAELLDIRENDFRDGLKLGTRWLCGYGIYDIRHFGGNLLVNVGDSCD